MKYEIIGWTYSDDPRYSDIEDNTKRAYLATTVIKELREKKYRIPGIYHIGGKGYVPVFNSGDKFRVSDRVWGGIMAQALREDNSSGMAYALWMMCDPNEKEENFPEMKVDRTRLVASGTVLQYDAPLQENYYTIGPPRNDSCSIHKIVKSTRLSNYRQKRKNI